MDCLLLSDERKTSLMSVKNATMHEKLRNTQNTFSEFLVDLNYNFECDWLFELSDNKLSDNNLASELVEIRSFLNQSQSRKL